MKTVVIARYKENLDWITNLQVTPVIVQKEVDFPNMGREPSSFLWFIISHYDRLEGEYYFVQGNPFDHCPDFLQQIYIPVTEFKMLGHMRLTSDGKGNPHHGGLPVEDVCCRITNRCGKNSFTFVAGGQFAVTAEEIKKHSLQYYLFALTVMAEDWNTIPWCFERLWEELFYKEKEGNAQ